MAAGRNEDVEFVAELHHQIRHILRVALERSALTPEARAIFPGDAETMWDRWQARYGDRFFDMMTMVRLGSAIERGIQAFYMDRGGFESLASLKVHLGKSGQVFQRLDPQNQSSAVSLVLRDTGVDIGGLPGFVGIRLAMTHRHLYAHNLGLVDQKYIDTIKGITGEDITAAPDFPPAYPAEDVYWFRPLRELPELIESARSFFRSLAETTGSP